jgi:hypothetical protein
MKSFRKGGRKKNGTKFNNVANMSEFYKPKFRYFPNHTTKTRVQDVPHTVELEGDSALGGLF